jgi:DNA-binding NarL/FixJ family response regulator
MADMGVLHITPSERGVLEELARGTDTVDIARRLGISEADVESCLASLVSRLGVASRTEAVNAAARRGLLMM